MCVTGMGNNMGKETDNVSQERETQKSSSQKSDINEKEKRTMEKGKEWRKVH